MYPEQRDFVRDIFSGKYAFVSADAGRQAGKSYAEDRAGIGLSLRQKNQSILWITPSHDQSRDAFERIELICIEKHISINAVKSPGDRHILFTDTNSKIHFRSSERFDLLRGKHPDYLILDEFAFFKPGAWEKALAPYMIANKDLVVVAVSTYQGKNDFWKFIQSGKNPKETMYVSHSLHYSMNPKANIPFIMEQKKKLPKAVFDQEYEGVCVSGSSSVFGSFEKAQTVIKYSEPVNGERYFFGIDWSGTGEDKTILTIIDSKGKTMFIHEVKALETPDQVTELIPIIEKWGACGYGEANGLGASGNQYLRKASLNVYDLHNDNKTKQLLVSEILKDIAENNAQLPEAVVCPELDNEMSLYQAMRTKTGLLTYSHPSGGHDDYIDSWMIANHARHDNLGQFSPVNTEDIYSNIGNGSDWY
jgi:hypothetical protein